MEICNTIVEKFETVWEETVTSFIKKVETICDDLPWPLDWFCHAVTFFIKIVEVFVHTLIEIFVTVVCYTVSLLVSAVAQMLNLILAIPGIGTLLKGFFGGMAWLWSQFVGAIDAGLGLIGIRPIKNLRVHIIILMHADRTLTVDPEAIGPAIARTEEIFRARADVDITTTVHQVRTPSVKNALHVDTGLGLIAEDMGDAGMYFQATIVDLLHEHSLLFLFKIGAPIVVFVVDGVGTTHLGCSAGPAADYVCVEGARLLTPRPAQAHAQGEPQNLATTTLAHELGHACGLLHDNQFNLDSGDLSNLMYPSPSDGATARGDNLSPWQRLIVRSSPHVTYL